METAWIQVFVLTLAQCIAPAGKMVCQEETVEYHFASEEDCANALVQIVDLAARAENVIVDRQRSNCRAGAKESVVYGDADAAKASLAGSSDFVLIDGQAPPQDFIQTAHAERLAALKTCDETNGVAPCKIGDIILEAPGEEQGSQVWRRDK